MKNYKALCVSMLLAVIFTIISCDDDEDKKPSIGFTSSASTVKEGETIDIPFTKAVPDGVTVQVELGGTATEGVDYEYGISTDGKNLVVEILEDNTYESGEEIEIEITGFSSGVTLGGTVIHTVVVEDPSMLIELTWDSGNGTAGDVDMDLVLWKYDELNDEFDFIDASDAAGNGFESLTLSGSFDNGTYGLTYLYFSGSSDELEFNVTFSTSAGSIEATVNELSFTGAYTLANVNNTPEVSVFIVQFLDKEGDDYNTFSTIAIPDEGSRQKKSTSGLIWLKK